MGNRGIVDVAGGVGPVVGVGPGEGHVADPELVVEAEECKRILDGVAAFDAEENGEFILSAGGENFGGGGAEGELCGVLADLFEDSVEEFEGAVGVTVAPLRGFGPEGEEGAGEVALASGLEVEGAAVERGGEVPGFIDKALRSVDVGVQDEGGLMDCAGFGIGGFRDLHRPSF